MELLKTKLIGDILDRFHFFQCTAKCNIKQNKVTIGKYSKVFI